jgi:glycosyltransferase involved in cell wall biosynthesis
VGGLHGVEGPAHLQSLRRLAAEVPVTFHVDAPLETLEQLYSGSSMFWHAAGFGESDDRHPERMEHFGITTVEAMAHGVVVLVVPKGGQSEVVDDGLNGFHWETTNELIERSRNVLIEPDAFDTIRERAIESARAYSTERFRGEVRGLLLGERRAAFR